MEKLTGIQLHDFPFKDLVKVSDLIYFEGPILSHFKDKDDRNYFFYWVDYDEKFNRWIVFKVGEFLLTGYLNGNVSLNELMLNKNNEFVYSVDIDENVNYHNALMIRQDELVQSYIPEIASYFKGEVLTKYKEYIKIEDAESLLTIMRQSAIYLKLETKGQHFLNLPSTKDVIEFLSNITKSYKNFIAQSFYNDFKDSILSSDRMNKIINTVTDELSLHPVDLGYSSFGIAIGSDILARQDDIKGYNEWKKTILKRYDEDVLEADFNSAESQNLIINKFPDEDARRKIYDPIIQTFNNSNYQVSKTDSYFRHPKRYKTISEKSVKKIIPPHITPEIKEESDIQLVTVVAAIGKGEDLSKLKVIPSNTLFINTDEITDYKPSQIEYDGNILLLNEPIVCHVTWEDSLFRISFDELNIDIKEKEHPKLLKAFHREFYKLYELYFIKDFTGDAKQKEILGKLVATFQPNLS